MKGLAVRRFSLAEVAPLAILGFFLLRHHKRLGGWIAAGHGYRLQTSRHGFHFYKFLIYEHVSVIQCWVELLTLQSKKHKKQLKCRQAGEKRFLHSQYFSGENCEEIYYWPEIFWEGHDLRRTLLKQRQTTNAKWNPTLYIPPKKSYIYLGPRPSKYYFLLEALQVLKTTTCETGSSARPAFVPQPAGRLVWVLGSKWRSWEHQKMCLSSSCFFQVQISTCIQKRVTCIYFWWWVSCWFTAIISLGSLWTSSLCWPLRWSAHEAASAR